MVYQVKILFILVSISFLIETGVVYSKVKTSNHLLSVNAIYYCLLIPTAFFLLNLSLSYPWIFQHSMNPIARGIRAGSWLPWVLRKIAIPLLPSSQWQKWNSVSWGILHPLSGLHWVSEEFLLKIKKLLLLLNWLDYLSENEITYWIKVFIDLDIYLETLLIVKSRS